MICNTEGINGRGNFIQDLHLRCDLLDVKYRMLEIFAGHN